jgi:hypothetical protein
MLAVRQKPQPARGDSVTRHTFGLRESLEAPQVRALERFAAVGQTGTRLRLRRLERRVPVATGRAGGETGSRRPVALRPSSDSTYGALAPAAPPAVLPVSPDSECTRAGSHVKGLQGGRRSQERGAERRTKQLERPGRLGTAPSPLPGLGCDGGAGPAASRASGK